MEDSNKIITIVRLLKQVMNTMRQNMEKQFKEMNLTGTQGMMIGILSHNNETKISDLSKQMGLSNSTVSGIVDRLEKQGIVQRIRSKEDRRVIYVDVTPQFKEITQNSFCKMEASFKEKMSGITSEETNKILDGLETLKKILDRQNI